MGVFPGKCKHLNLNQAVVTNSLEIPKSPESTVLDLWNLHAQIYNFIAKLKKSWGDAGTLWTKPLVIKDTWEHQVWAPTMSAIGTTAHCKKQLLHRNGLYKKQVFIIYYS